MNLLITGAFPYDQAQIDSLTALGYTVTYIQDERKPLEIDCSVFDVVICNGLFLYTPIESFTNLKLVQLTSAGTDRVPVDYIKSHNITLCNAKGVYSIPMAEWVLLNTLAIYKNAKFFYKNQNSKIWEKQRVLPELSNKTVCIVGTGSVGMECAKRFYAFNTKIIGVDIIEPETNMIDTFYHISDLNRALENSDVIVLTLPLTPNTRGLFNKETFRYVKQNAVLINVSRGGIICEADLVEALNGRLFSGVALDVFETEPLPKTSPLWNFKNVYLSPHNSFVSENNNKRLFELLYQNCNDFIRNN